MKATIKRVLEPEISRVSDTEREDEDERGNEGLKRQELMIVD